MPTELIITPHGHLAVAAAASGESEAPDAVMQRLARALQESTARGLLHLATVELETRLPPALAYPREFAQRYLTERCRAPAMDPAAGPAALPPPAREELAFVALRCPPLRGSEYLSAELLAAWWSQLDALVLDEMRAFAGGAVEYLRHLNPIWRLVGRVTFHLAENKRDQHHPFAFLATYAHRLSAQARVQHLPLGRALQEYASARDRPALIALLSPVRDAAEKCSWVRALVDSGDIYQPLAWTPREAYQFLQDIPALEAAGLIVRVPDWWHAKHPPRPTVNVRVGGSDRQKFSATSLLDFRVNVALDGEPLSEDELQSLLASSGGLVSLRGQWVEVDRDRLAEALEHWQSVEQAARGEGISFFEGMRLLSGASLPQDDAQALAAETAAWTGISAGPALAETLRRMREPEAARRDPPGLRTELRPYQRVGVEWLRFMSGLGLGACLADDMGLGKTIQVIGLLLQQRPKRAASAAPAPALLVVPASLVGNWQAELSRFAPSLNVRIAHPSVGKTELTDEKPAAKALAAEPDGCDLVITTYGMLAKLDWLRGRTWNLLILDEAQAIKNAGARQTRAVKQLSAVARLALTGTPIENHLSDLWSLFDFLNPGLLGSAAEFGKLTKKLAARDGPGFAPLRTLVRPYLLRRLKTDKTVIRDLPEKSEVTAYCSLSRAQAALYEQAVRDLGRQLEKVEGIQRRGVVLASLMRLKQICNHPSQSSGDGRYEPRESGKFQRLSEICGELAERQQKALVFTQFRELTEPLAALLAEVFGRPGLVLHGQTPVRRRRELVEAFQQETGPPFFVLSLKAGGTGLNLTEAAHVIHFDRWWNPAVENQATDRAFRIGQKRNVLVHKFVCRGTLEERIDELIAEKAALARELLDASGETLLTEMSDQELLRFVSLDLRKAIES